MALSSVKILTLLIMTSPWALECPNASFSYGKNGEQLLLNCHRLEPIPIKTQEGRLVAVNSPESPLPEEIQASYQSWHNEKKAMKEELRSQKDVFKCSTSK